MTGQVTALGIRDGDPAVLQALVDRRGFAVLAYCERLCPPGVGVEAAADAFARFRATVLTVAQPAQLDPEAALISATRHAAAARVPRPTGPAAGPLGRLLGGKPPTELIDAVPELLVDRADGTLDPADEDRLVRLLDASAAARAVEQRFLAAEHAYRTAAPRPISSGVRERIVATMAAAAGPAVNGNGAYAGPEAEPAVESEVEPRFAHDDGAVGSASGPVEAPGDEALHEAAPAMAADEETPVAPDDEAAGEPEPEPEREPIAPPPGGSVSISAVPVPVPDFEEPLTEEWALPPEATEIAAARLRPPVEDPDEEAAHLQSASGAVDEPLVDPADRVAEVAAQLHRPKKLAGRNRPPVPPAPLIGASAETEAPSAASADHSADTPSRGVPRIPAERHALPGRAALAPAGAVVTIAAIGALVASGVFGGNEPSPPLDTGIVPPRALQAVPEGEAEAVVDDLRSAAADARRRRLADRRQALAAAQLQPDPAPETTTDGDTEDRAGDDAPQTTAPAPDNDASPAPAQDAPDAPTGDGDGGTGDTGGANDPPTIEGDVGGTTTP